MTEQEKHDLTMAVNQALSSLELTRHGLRRCETDVHRAAELWRRHFEDVPPAIPAPAVDVLAELQFIHADLYAARNGQQIDEGIARLAKLIAEVSRHDQP